MHLGKRSQEKLKSVHHQLKLLFEEAIKDSPIDFSVIEGHRGKEMQNHYYESGKSQVKFPNGNHNKYPSLAVDAIPYPVNWDNIEEFVLLGNHIIKTAFRLGISISWGGKWKNFKDYPHYELKGE